MAARVFNGLAGAFIEIAGSSVEIAGAFMRCLQGFNACRWSFIASERGFNGCKCRFNRCRSRSGRCERAFVGCRNGLIECRSSSGDCGFSFVRYPCSSVCIRVHPCASVVKNNFPSPRTGRPGCGRRRIYAASTRAQRISSSRSVSICDSPSAITATVSPTALNTSRL